MDKRDALDLDVEQFNPEHSRRIYEAQGYSKEHIDRLVAFDKLIYARPVEEIRAAVAKRKDDG